MPEKVTIREDLEVIQVDSYGEVSALDLQQSLEEVAMIRDERGFSRVLVDATEETSLPSTMPAFLFGSELARMMGPMKVAVVGTPKLNNEIRFIETVARNRGAQLRVFGSAEAAFTWLAEEPNNPGAGDGT
jgi:hypothetical protein